MLYTIRHTTHYHYSQPVILKPHHLRLRPRSDVTQALRYFDLKITPEPSGISSAVDVDGNASDTVWFEPQTTDQLIITTQSKVETFRDNPFHYLAEPWATFLPIDYPTSLNMSLQPYLANPLWLAPAPEVVQLAQQVLQAIDRNTSYFLTALNQRIYESCEYTTRKSGDPLPPGITWTEKRGSCRDLTTLFMEACRCVGLAARFVSGYQEGDLENAQGDLHAWAEVYVPGAGWRGFDPTLGLAVANQHVALVASPYPRQAAPVFGALREGQTVSSTLTSEVLISAS